MIIFKDGKVGPAKIVVLSANEKWVVHIVGPDDVIEQPDELTALRYANGTNVAIERDRRQFANDPNYPFAVAIVRKADDPQVCSDAD